MNEATVHAAHFATELQKRSGTIYNAHRLIVHVRISTDEQGSLSKPQTGASRERAKKHDDYQMDIKFFLPNQP